MTNDPIPPKPASILLVDDDPLMRLQLRACLEKEGYRIAEAQNGSEGLAAFSRIQPDVILLDAMMPEIDGFEFCDRLQKLPNSNQTLVLMITGLDDQDSVDRAFTVGAVDFVTKPVHWAVLRQRVRRLIQQSHLQKQLEAANQALQELAALDGLTQVANRRRFDEYLTQEWRRMRRDLTPLSLILCDIDCFKPYNDTYGHQAGDRCLQQVAHAIEAAVKRPADLVARYGGEEFAVLLPNTNTEGALYVAEMICAQVRLLNIPHGVSQVNTHVTLSAGVASTIPQLGAEADVLIAAADKALYKAKETGRDRCCLHTMTIGRAIHS